MENVWHRNFWKYIGKSEVVSFQAMKVHLEVEEVWLQTFLTSALDGSE